MTEEKKEGYIQIPNDIIEALMRVNIYPYSYRVLWVVIRQTIGWDKKEDHISFNQIAKKTGLDRRLAARGMKDLVRNNIVIKRDDSFINKYRFNKNFETWKSVIKQDTSVDRDDKVSSKKMAKLSSAEMPTTYNINTITTYIHDIIDYWNTKGIKALEERESKIKKKTESKIKTWLKDYSLDEIREAIDNYIEILKSEDYYFSHKWQLWEFLDRGLVNFLSKSEPQKNYLRDKEFKPSQVGKNLKPITGREEQYEKASEAKRIELKKKYEKDTEEAMKKGNRDKLDEIDNKIKDEMAAFSREYWDKKQGEKKEARI